MKKKSNEEINILVAQLRESLQDVLPSNPKFENNFYLYRWLIKNQMKVDRTETMIRKSIEWRQQVNLDELAEQELAFFSPGLEKTVILNFSGLTKAGQPVTTTNSEGVNFREVLQTYGRDAMLRYLIQFYAKLEKCMMDHFEKTSLARNTDILEIGTGTVFQSSSWKLLNLNSDSNFNSVSKSELNYDSSWDFLVPVQIVSYKNFSLWNATCVEAVQVFLEGTRIGMTLFPSLIQRIYFVNLNKFSSMILKMIKPMIKSDVLNLEFFDTDQAKWSKVLLDFIDADQLEPYFGGTGVFHKKTEVFQFNQGCTVVNY